MVENHRCRCPICLLERELISALQAPASLNRFRTLSVDHPALSDFDSPLTLIVFLHDQQAGADRTTQSNEIIKVLLSRKESREGQGLLQDLLVQAFIPTLHKTYRETCFYFSNLNPEDVGQQVVTSFLELANSPAIGRRDEQGKQNDGSG